MSADILDGKALAQSIQAEIAAEVAQFVQQHGVKPTLAAVLVGHNPASERPVRTRNGIASAFWRWRKRHSRGLGPAAAWTTSLIKRVSERELCIATFLRVTPFWKRSIGRRLKS